MRIKKLRNLVCAWLEAPGVRAAVLVGALSLGALAQTPAQKPAQTPDPVPAPPATTQTGTAASTSPAAAGNDPALPTGNDAGEFTIKRSVDEVNLIFTVTDKHNGRFVKDLQQSDFALLDDQKAPAKVTKFVQQTN